jgi:single-strand DNA-binding protein
MSAAGYGRGTRWTRRTQDRPVTRRPIEKESWTVNKVLLAGRLTRDPEMRALASGKHVTQFSVATTEYAGNGKERPEYHNIVTWDRLAEICGRYLGKGQQVAIEGRIQTRTWDDEKGLRHWKTEIVAQSVEMLSGRKKKDYAAETATDGLEAADSTVDTETGAALAAAAEPIPEEIAA